MVNYVESTFLELKSHPELGEKWLQKKSRKARRRSVSAIWSLETSSVAIAALDG